MEENYQVLIELGEHDRASAIVLAQEIADAIDGRVDLLCDNGEVFVTTIKPQSNE